MISEQVLDLPRRAVQREADLPLRPAVRVGEQPGDDLAPAHGVGISLPGFQRAPADAGLRARVVDGLVGQHGGV